MKYTVTNRMVNGVGLMVIHPETGKPVDGVIDTDTESASTTKHFNRLYKQGDLETIKTKPKLKSKGVE